MAGREAWTSTIMTTIPNSARMMLLIRLSFPSMFPTIVLSFPFGTEPAFTPPGVDPRAPVIPITQLVIDLLSAAADVALDLTTISTLVGRRGGVGTALTTTLLSPFSRHLEGARPDPSFGRPSSLLGCYIGLGVLTICHSPASRVRRLGSGRRQSTQRRCGRTGLHLALHTVPTVGRLDHPTQRRPASRTGNPYRSAGKAEHSRGRGCRGAVFWYLGSPECRHQSPSRSR
jgi:hypothetical protein